MASMQQGVEWLSAALAQLHDQQQDSPARRAAESALVSFRSQDSAWGVCLHILSTAPTTAADATNNNTHLLLFAAQTLRAKLNEQGSSLDTTHLEQLKQALLHRLLNPELTPLLRQLCLAVASLAALLPSWQAWLAPVCGSLPWRNAVQLLHDVAEEACSDWRHVAMPGLTSSEKLSWATTTRDRFRSWSAEALQLLHTGFQQQQQQQQLQPQQQQSQATVALLESLTSWVRLGALHHVTQQLGEATAQVGLLHIQSQQEEVVSAALGLLSDLPEYAPEQLLQAMEPHMLQVEAAALHAAAAAVQSAAAAVSQTPDLMHTAAWVAAFAAHAAAVPQRLLLADDGEDDGAGSSGQQLREALLQVAALPHTHNSQLVCLPALHVWSTVLGHESPASAAAFTAAGGGSGGLSRASTAAGDPEPPTAVALAAAALAAAEAAGGGVGGAAAAREPAGGVPSCVVAACHRLLLQTASNCMLWAQSAEGREAANSTEAAAAVHDLFLAICCVLGQVQYLQGIVLVAGGQLQQQQQQSGVPWWQQDASLQQAVQHIAGTPDQLRLQVAVEMAAAAVVQPLCDAADAAGNAGNGCCLDHQVCSSSITELLSRAAGQIAQTSQTGDPHHVQLVLAFCKAVQVWSDYLACHFAHSPEPEGTAGMGSLLQLLVALASTTQPSGDADSSAIGGSVRTAAASAVRALTCSALHLGLGEKLWQGAPLLLQVVQHLSGVDSADQDLFASLAMCLAAADPSTTPQQDLQELRAASCRQLVQPVVDHLDALLQQLQSGVGQQQESIAKPADMLLCQYMVRVRVVLEAAWQRHEQQRRACPFQQHDHGGEHVAAAAATPAASVAASQSASGMDEDTEGGESGFDFIPQQHQGSDLGVSFQGFGQPPQPQNPDHVADSDPAVQLVCSRMLDQLHTLVVQHAASGKFLQHHAKCLAKLLKLQPELLLKQQERLVQFVEVCVLGLVRPGGCGLAEPLYAAVELCCHQQRAALLLEAAPCLNQAYAQLWTLPAVLSLQQPGQGDIQPDLTDAVLKLSTAFVRHVSLLQPSSTQLAAIVPGITAAAAACARCCHKKVGSHALATLLAILAAAASETGAGAAAGSQQQHVVQEVVASHGHVIAAGALGALLVASPLPRLQKVSSVLLDLAVLANIVEQQQQLTVGQLQHLHQPAAVHTAGVLHRWLLQATQGLPLTASEAAELAAACAGLLGAAPAQQQQAAGSSSSAAVSGGVDGSSSSMVRHAVPVPASRSYVAARRLKKKLRDFAERHMRTSTPLVQQVGSPPPPAPQSQQ